MTLRAHITSCQVPAQVSEAAACEQGILCAFYDLKANNAIFSGHFPGNPILPAVVQCLMVQMLAEEMAGTQTALFHIDDAKFVAPVLPPCVLTVQVQKGRKEGLFVGKVQVGEQLHAKIHLLQGE